MKNFLLRASTPDTNSFQTFSLADIPVLYDKKHFALIKLPYSPILELKSIVRGDPSTGLFEGDIVQSEDKTYIVCYERGFYAITGDYQTQYLYQLKNPQVIGNYATYAFPIPINIRTRQLFKYQNLYFDIKDIVGNWGNNLVIQSSKQPLNPQECYQEACLTYKHTKLFLNDTLDVGAVEIIGGRICTRRKKGIYDLATKSYLGDIQDDNT